jgi:hypothetical protein
LAAFSAASLAFLASSRAFFLDFLSSAIFFSCSILSYSYLLRASAASFSALALAAAAAASSIDLSFCLGLGTAGLTSVSSVLALTGSFATSLTSFSIFLRCSFPVSLACSPALKNVSMFIIFFRKPHSTEASVPYYREARIWFFMSVSNF